MSLSPHPVSTLIQAFSDNQDTQSLFDICGSLFEKKSFPRGQVLWESDQEATELFILEKGELLLTMKDLGHEHVIETLLPGTMVMISKIDKD